MLRFCLLSCCKNATMIFVFVILVQALKLYFNGDNWFSDRIFVGLLF